METPMQHSCRAGGAGLAPRRGRTGSGLLALAVAALAALLAPAAARAQSLDTEPCTGLVSRGPSLVQPAVLPAAVQAGEAALTFIGHATFFIESPGGVTIATDYSGAYQLPAVPDVVTM